MGMRISGGPAVQTPQRARAEPKAPFRSNSILDKRENMPRNTTPHVGCILNKRERRAMALSDSEQLQLTLLDKGLIGLLLVVAGFAFNSMLERFKSNRAKALDALRSDLTLQLEKQREQRTAIGDFARKISVGYQAMEWFT